VATDRPAIHLTFDDGPGPATAQLLDILQAYDVRASFFVVGRNVVNANWCLDTVGARYPVIRALRDGHEVGNHTFSHELHPKAERFVQDVVACDALIGELLRRARCITAQANPGSIALRSANRARRKRVSEAMDSVRPIGRSADACDVLSILSA
jgi:peptidoglycan/xylan/chitin deacetylase (PgdA/CDA1 family)